MDIETKQVFHLSRADFPEEYAIYEKYEHEVFNYCNANIDGNSMMILCLYGCIPETARPTILYTYEGTKSDNWKEPVVPGLDFVSSETVFWGAMAAKHKPEPQLEAKN